MSLLSSDDSVSEPVFCHLRKPRVLCPLCSCNPLRKPRVLITLGLQFAKDGQFYLKYKFP